MKRNFDLLNDFEENFSYGLIPATEEEARMCEEKEKSIGAIPEGFVKANDKTDNKYYKLAPLDQEEVFFKIKAQKLRRLKNIDRQTRTSIILHSVTLGFTVLIAAMLFAALFLL